MLTTKGDVRALDEVTKVAKELCPEIDVEGLLAVWRQYFKSTPWDPEQKVVEMGDWKSGTADLRAKD